MNIYAYFFNSQSHIMYVLVKIAVVILQTMDHKRKYILFMAVWACALPETHSFVDTLSPARCLPLHGFAVLLLIVTVSGNHMESKMSIEEIQRGKLFL